jgi:phage/plasmid-associated DNA primase
MYDDIVRCDGSHNAVAAIAHKLLSDRYVCATPNGKLWYFFDGSLWREDAEAIALRHELSSTVREAVRYSLGKLNAESADDDMASASQCGSTSDGQGKILALIAFKLQDCNFKDSVVKEMREYFYDKLFLDRLDSNMTLIAFTNGVWDLRTAEFRPSQPTDWLSISVGYDYSATADAVAMARVREYWACLHPEPMQRDYVIRTLARQLYGDHGNELFHVHAGHRGTAGNGKSKFFEALEDGLGDYVRKFSVETITAKQRPEAGKPMPECEYWRGRRILYCTEPDHDDMLNSGIMKDLTGGENVMFRLLYSNEVRKFRPQFKLHIMCNNPPKVDGSDDGVRRRIRKIDYVSRFVDAADVDHERHMYLRDATVLSAFKNDVAHKMEFVRYLLQHFSLSYAFEMPDSVRTSSCVFLHENDSVTSFVAAHVRRSSEPGAYFSLKMATDMFRADAVDAGTVCRVKTLKTDLEKALGCVCTPQKRIGNASPTNVFLGYVLYTECSIERLPDDGL